MSPLHTTHCNLMNEGLSRGEGRCICHFEHGPVSQRDDVNHPTHYTSHPTGVQFIEIAETMTFNLGSALKYIWRIGLKSEEREKDLRKAIWYLEREIGRLRKLNGQDNQPKEHGAAPSTTIHGVGEAPGDLAARYHSGG